MTSTTLETPQLDLNCNPEAGTGYANVPECLVNVGIGTSPKMLSLVCDKDSYYIPFSSIGHISVLDGVLYIATMKRTFKLLHVSPMTIRHLLAEMAS